MLWRNDCHQKQRNEQESQKTIRNVSKNNQKRFKSDQKRFRNDKKRLKKQSETFQINMRREKYVQRLTSELQVHCF